VLVVSSFGLLSETVIPLVNLMRTTFSVFVCEFAAIPAPPGEICERILNEMPEKQDIVAIIGHSAGGVWAFEFGKVLRSATICLLDCYMPPMLGPLNKFDMLRFVVEPFRRMKGLPSMEEVPSVYVVDILRGLLSEFGAPDFLCSLYASAEQLLMQEKMNKWTPKEILKSPWVFVSCSSSRDNLAPWKACFGNEPVGFSVQEGHFDMLQSAAVLLLEILK